jgi:Neuraminidase (sialidase)
MLLRLQTGLGEAFSADGGKTWHSIEKSGIWGPNARFFIRRLRSGRLLLVNHARESGEDTSGADASGAISKANISGTDMVAGKRNRLAAFLSDDEGKTWSRPLILDEREDVSYPDGVEREDGLIELIYDYSRFAQKEILMAKFREEDILAGRMVSADGKLRILVDKAGE